MATINEVDKHISNIDSLMAEFGGGNSQNDKITKIIDDYKDINKVWNDFLDRQTQSIDPSFNATNEEEKIHFLAKNTFYYDSQSQDNFKSQLKAQLTKRDNERAKLKSLAEEILEKQSELVKKNKEIIKDLSDSLKDDIEKNKKLSDEIKQLDQERLSTNNKISEREFKINELKAEISGLDPDKDKQTIIAKRKQIQFYEKEIMSLSDKNNDIEKDTNIKQKQKIVIGKRPQKIEELSKKNDEFAKLLDGNYKKFDEEFSKDGISIKHPGISNDEHEVSQNPLNNNLENNTNNTQQASNFQVKSQGTSQGNENNKLQKLSDKEIATNMCREFRNMTEKEQKSMLNGYGYDDLVAMMPYLNMFDRKRMSNIIGETRDELEIPDRNYFSNKIDSILPGEGSKLYDLLFINNKPREFKSLNVDELREIHNAISTVNAERNEIGRNNPELLEYFDNNFVQFVQKGSLMERLKTGRIKGFFADMVNGKQKAVRDKLSASMIDYSRARSDEKINKQVYENELRGILGKDVKPIAYNEKRSNTRYKSKLQEKDEQNVIR